MTRKKCSCAVDQDGQCVRCRSFFLKLGVDFTTLTEKYERQMEMARDRYKANYQALAEAAMEEAHNSDFCAACGKRYIDLLISKLVRSLEYMPRATAESTFKKIMELFRKGIRNLKTPLTEKAWEKLKAGWKGR